LKETKSILWHELEEARIIQIITEKVKEPEQWVKVIEEHREIMDHLEKKISQLNDSSQEAGQEIKAFGKYAKTFLRRGENCVSSCTKRNFLYP
jgi:hypothetical protein